MAPFFGKKFPWTNLVAPWQKIDWFLLVLIIAVTAWGSLTIYSVPIKDSVNDWLAHASTGGFGVFIALFLARWHYQRLLDWHWFIYAITNFVLLAVLLIGVTVGGAQRWLTIAGLSLQPSELAKLVIIITLSAVLHNRPTITRIGGMFQILLVVAVPWILVVAQPDLGTSLVFGAIALVMLYWANTNISWLMILVSPVVAAITFHLYFPAWLSWTALIFVMAWRTLPGHWMTGVGSIAVNISVGFLGNVFWNLLEDYQQARLIAFLNPNNVDQYNVGYQLLQSHIAIGAGGLWGQGLNQGKQTQLSFIPEQHNDFIFSAVGEELGFIGSFALLILFWLIFARLITIALRAKDHFGSFLAIGVFAMILFQVLVNISMTIGLAPITGLPLPWMSYGRSALVTNFIAIGLVESVANHREQKRYF